MGDGLKLNKDKRHRSSSSIAGVVIEGTRSERKLDIRTSIPEADDQFALAESRCDELQEKLDLVKVLKRKRKLKKRSMTRVADPPPLNDNIPLISVHTQPKKKVSQQATRMRRLEVPPNPTRGYLDPATVEQHRMLGQVRGYNQMHRPQQDAGKQKQGSYVEAQPLHRQVRRGRARADGDAMTACEGVQLGAPLEVACGDDDVFTDFSDHELFASRRQNLAAVNKRAAYTGRQQPNTAANARRPQPQRDAPTKDASKKYQEVEEERSARWRVGSPPHRRRQADKAQHNAAASVQVEERPVVELFSKALRRATPPPHAPPAPPDRRPYRKGDLARETQLPKSEDITTGPLRDVPSMEIKKENYRHPRRVKYRSRRYELPTVASQMKQAGMRYYYDNGNATNIPFVVSKSTAPSHNIGVNIQQVLNGIKIQQPLSGIPYTIAHHMGLGHIPTYGTRSAVTQPSLDHREMNAIRVGRRLVRLPSHRYMSYNRLLSLYRDGDGMVPRFLRAISRPHYFYTSMYNLATNRDDADGATSKGRSGSQEAKQSLAEYAGLYREYEHIEKCIKDGDQNPELEHRREELARELAAREENIRRVVQEFRSDADQTPLRASASTADEAYRHSTFKLNLGDAPQ